VLLGGIADAYELVFVNGSRVVQQAADQSGFAIVHAAGGGKAEELAQK
jgi:hypothetical protein